MRDPFRIDGPACISFSGGRTSGYMLHRILQAHGGTLPDDVVVVFANTGREFVQTLAFVERCAAEWKAPITWVEDGRGVIEPATASINGEPFSALIARKKFLPNPVMRFCTSDLKIKPINAYLKSLGWTDWATVIGLRADEPRRVANARAQNDKAVPLADAGVTREDVVQFWTKNSFDLELPTHGGFSNCDGCFLKGAGLLLATFRAHPERAVWWIEQEAAVGARFRSDRPGYAELARYAAEQMDLFDDDALADCACTD